MIINSDFDTLTIMDNDKLIFRQLNEYNLLKYDVFKGNRIIVKLNDNCDISETFNEGIFNVRYNQTKMQLRDKIELSKRLIFCIDNKTDIPIKQLMLNKQRDTVNQDYLLNALKPYYDKIKFTNDEIIVKDVFKVDKNGQAYKKNNNKWSSLCIVVSRTNDEIIKTDLGKLKISFKTLEILYKVLFLIFPNTNDKIFMNQLNASLRNQL
jgi:hypothetical protein